MKKDSFNDLYWINTLNGFSGHRRYFVQVWWLASAKVCEKMFITLASLSACSRGLICKTNSRQSELVTQSIIKKDSSEKCGYTKSVISGGGLGDKTEKVGCVQRTRGWACVIRIPILSHKSNSLWFSLGLQRELFWLFDLCFLKQSTIRRNVKNGPGT